MKGIPIYKSLKQFLDFFFYYPHNQSVDCPNISEKFIIVGHYDTLSNFVFAMGEYKRDKAILSARRTLQLLNVTEKELSKFDALCEDFELTVGDVTGWQEDDFQP